MENEEFKMKEVTYCIFSAVFQIKQHFGLNYLVSLLIGAKLQKILKHAHQELPSFGALKRYSFEQVKVWVMELVDKEYLIRTKGEYPLVQLAEKAKNAQAEGDEVELTKPDLELVRKSVAFGESVDLTYSLYNEGKSIKVIAAERGLAQETVVNHLAAAYERGKSVDINQFVPSSKQEVITQAFQKHGTQFLTPVRKELGMSFSWEDLKLVRAKLLRQDQPATV